MQHIRHLYPGGNTARGFYSYYPSVFQPRRIRRLVILKGGPGVGKSTFMRTVADVLQEKGQSIEFLHCSSDNNSLDGILAPGIGLALVDGTAPHVVDPILPGAMDGILNLGDCLDEAAMEGSKHAILALKGEISRRFERAYHYLRAGEQLMLDTREVLTHALDRGMVNAAGYRICKSLLEGKPRGAVGQERRFFGQAFTPGGQVSTLDTLTEPHLIVLKGPWGFPTHLLLDEVRREALACGQDIECLMDPLTATELAGVILPDLGASVFATDCLPDWAEHAETCLDLSAFLDAALLRQEATILEYNETQYRNLLDHASRQIAQAKALHDELETYYIGNMDFDRVSQLRSSLLDDIQRWLD